MGVSKSSGSFSSLDRTALAIGIVATIIIVLVFVAPILLFARLRMVDMTSMTPPSVSNSRLVYSHSDAQGHLKVMGQSFRPAPLASSLCPAQAGASAAQCQLLHNQLDSGDFPSNPAPISILKKKKALGHEWYV